MVGVGSCASGGKAEVVTGNDAVYVAAADAPRGLGRDAAGAHGADAAADALLTEFTVGGLVFNALLPGVCSHLTACFQQPFGGLFHLLDSDQFHSRNVESAERFALSLLLSLRMISGLRIVTFFTMALVISYQNFCAFARVKSPHRGFFLEESKIQRFDQKIFEGSARREAGAGGFSGKQSISLFF